MGSGFITGSSGVRAFRNDEYEMPKVFVGQVVLWSYNTGSEVSPAVVVGVGSRSLSLHVHVKDFKDHVIKTGTRHVTDPFLVKFPQHDGGCWRYNGFDEIIMALIAENNDRVEHDYDDGDDDIPEEE